MGSLNDIVGVIGGTILCLELIVVILLLLGLNAGLAFGLRWILRKSEWMHSKIEWALGLVTKNVDRGMNVIAAPVILSTSAWRGLKAGLYRATHWPASATQPTAVLPASVPTAKDSTRAA